MATKKNINLFKDRITKSSRKEMARELITAIDAKLQVEERMQTAEKTEKDGKGSVLADLHEKAEKTEQKSKSPGKKKTKAKEETR